MATLEGIREFHDWMLENLPYSSWMKPGGDKRLVCSWSEQYLTYGGELPTLLECSLRTLQGSTIHPWEERHLVEDLLVNGIDSKTYRALERFWIRCGGGLSKRDKLRLVIGNLPRMMALGMYNLRKMPWRSDKYRDALVTELLRRDLGGVTSIGNGYLDLPQSRNVPARMGRLSRKQNPHEVAQYIAKQMVAGLDRVHLSSAAYVSLMDGVNPESPLSGELHALFLEKSWDTTPLGSNLLENIEFLRKERVKEFISLAEEYNMDWAIAGFDWSRGEEPRLERALRFFVEDSRERWEG